MVGEVAVGLCVEKMGGLLSRSCVTRSRGELIKLERSHGVGGTLSTIVAVWSAESALYRE